MEIELIRRESPVWQPEPPLRRRTTLSLESVIPDTRQDVKSILAARGSLLLKGKELSPGGVTVSGEARAALLVLAEDGVSLDVLRLEKPFRLEFEVPDPDEKALPSLSWRLTGVEGRILNPRKLGAELALEAELQVWRRGSAALGMELPEGKVPGLHLQTAERESLAVTGVCEKSFTLREQFPVSASGPVPARIAGEELLFRTLDCEQVGDRAIVRGELQLTVWGLSEEGDPLRCSYRSSFSQLMETGGAVMDRWSLSLQPCSVRLELSEAIAGERALDAEIRVLAQLCIRTRQTVQAVTDAYSSQMPCLCRREELCLTGARERQKARLRAEEPLELPEDCGDLLAVLPEPGALAEDGGSLPLSLTLLYRDREGFPAAARRSLILRGEALPAGPESAELTELTLELRPRGEGTGVLAEAELVRETRLEESLSCVTALELREEERLDPSLVPAITLLRPAGESLWELAERFHSSVELIRALNAPDARLLLIPAERT